MSIAQTVEGFSPTQQGEQTRELQPLAPEINVGGTERLVSGALGGYLVLNGLNRLSIGGLIEAGLGAALVHRAVTGNCKVYGALGVNTAGEGAAPEEYFDRGIQVCESFTIDKPAGELYAFWRRFENLPKFMTHLESVTTLEGDGNRSRWVAKGPAGMSVQWDAEVINDEPDRLIAWRSLGGADVDNAGSVRFVEAPGGRGTEVHVAMDYIPPAGRVGSWLAKLFGRDADQLVRSDLRQFKQLMETGEIPTIEGQPRGTCGGGGERHRG
jgi:uncharacterized membrane protein